MFIKLGGQRCDSGVFHKVIKMLAKAQVILHSMRLKSIFRESQKFSTLARGFSSS